MRRRKLAAVVVAGAVGGLVAKRRGAAAAGRAEVWFDDGSMVSVPATSDAGARLVELADDVQRAAS
jgi:hypothetical protein